VFSTDVNPVEVQLQSEHSSHFVQVCVHTGGNIQLLGNAVGVGVGVGVSSITLSQLCV